MSLLASRGLCALKLAGRLGVGTVGSRVALSAFTPRGTQAVGLPHVCNTQSCAHKTPNVLVCKSARTIFLGFLMVNSQMATADLLSFPGVRLCYPLGNLCG